MDGLTRWMHHGIADAWWRCRRGALRLYRMAGPDGLAIVLGLLLMSGLIAAVWHVRQARVDLQAQRRAAGETIEALPQPQMSHLQRFEQMLPAHDDIPELLERLFELGVEERLVLSRGEYRAQTDEVGRFMRYRMTMPVKGDAPSVQRFIERALAGNRSLVFESVQFKRERIQAQQVEAIVQWTLVTGLPGLAVPESRRKPLQESEEGMP